ncbi:beta-propeller fold lactonase family protein, partial [Cellulomonas sp. GbtcB1]|uniref:beta-propeller fold lactonase family protein n=1 Tax=Cellulomonas sp. GbtcB1 TaxID=2824746 RepID=UPI001C3023ED
SLLAVDRQAGLLLAVGEHAGGTVPAFRVGSGADGRPAHDRTGTASSGGDDPCHVLLEPEGRVAYVANYSSGSLAALEL